MSGMNLCSLKSNNNWFNNIFVRISLPGFIIMILFVLEIDRFKSNTTFEKYQNVCNVRI